MTWHIFNEAGPVLPDAHLDNWAAIYRSRYDHNRNTDEAETLRYPDIRIESIAPDTKVTIHDEGHPYATNVDNTGPAMCRCSTNVEEKPMGQLIATASRETVQELLDAAAAQLAKLDGLPGEPETDDGCPVLMWRMSFANDNHVTIRAGKPCECHTPQYTYAALRCADNGLWYLTGPAMNGPLTWEQLSRWLLLDNHLIGDLWLATGWASVHASEGAE